MSLLVFKLTVFLRGSKLSSVESKKISILPYTGLKFFSPSFVAFYYILDFVVVDA